MYSGVGGNCWRLYYAGWAAMMMTGDMRHHVWDEGGWFGLLCNGSGFTLRCLASFHCAAKLYAWVAELSGLSSCTGRPFSWERRKGEASPLDGHGHYHTVVTSSDALCDWASSLLRCKIEDFDHFQAGPT